MTPEEKYLREKTSRDAGNVCIVCGSAIELVAEPYMAVPLGGVHEREIMRVRSVCGHWGLEMEMSHDGREIV